MNIEITAAAGASIGAVNSALIAQGDYEAAESMWKSVEAKDIITLPEKMTDCEDILKLSNIAALTKEIYKNSGLDSSPLELLLRRVLDEDRIRKSPIALGIAAYSLSDKRETTLFREDIPNGMMIEYIMASACFPLFGPRVINKKRFIDGGVSNNMPVSMMTERGIYDIIAVNVRGIGVYKSFNTAGRNVINIKSAHPETGALEFNREGIARAIEEGYLETLKVFGRCLGGEYAFYSGDYLGALGKYSSEILNGLESAARIFDIDKLRPYTVDSLTDAVMDAYNEFECTAETEDGIIKKLDMPKNITAYLVGILEKNGGEFSDFIKEKLSVIGSAYDAASAIAYFKRK